ncbi:glycosyltransferase family 2 protein [Morganella morganii]|uniref:glycosyltransferase family 2 protein n=1 Tax=Morganella morganii TaxID=582 RepID=UPI0021CFF1AC|nr:glycosyltransferase family 2 protein [Morganella morganii]MCU6354957.1 glycosyltransferase [Morganella morganii]
MERNLRDIVSIIIPAYNAERWILECINSCINQIYKNIEIIIINDGSKDNTEKICQKLAKIDNRIIINTIENNGCANARKIGVEISKGDYLIFLDSDDLLTKNSVQDLIFFIKKNNYDIAIGQSNIIGAKKTTTEFKIINNDIISSFLRGNIPTSLWPCIFKKEVLKKINMSSDLKVSEDLMIISQLILLTKNIGVCSNLVYNYRVHSQSTTSNLDEQKYNDNYRAHKSIEHNFIENLDEKYSQDILVYRLNYLYNLITINSPHAKTLYIELIKKYKKLPTKNFPIIKKIIFFMYKLNLANNKNLLLKLMTIKRYFS